MAGIIALNQKGGFRDATTNRRNPREGRGSAEITLEVKRQPRVRGKKMSDADSLPRVSIAEDITLGIVAERDHVAQTKSKVHRLDHSGVDTEG
jgi:hypothetical protein